jgi:hypothetical protein
MEYSDVPELQRDGRGSPAERLYLVNRQKAVIGAARAVAGLNLLRMQKRGLKNPAAPNPAPAADRPA